MFSPEGIAGSDRRSFRCGTLVNSNAFICCLLSVSVYWHILTLWVSVFGFRASSWMDTLRHACPLCFSLFVCPLPFFCERVMPFLERIQRAARHRAQLHLVATPTAAVQTLEADCFQSGNSFFFHVCTSCFCNGFVLVLSHGVDIVKQSGYTVRGAGNVALKPWVHWARPVSRKSSVIVVMLLESFGENLASMLLTVENISDTVRTAFTVFARELGEFPWTPPFTVGAFSMFWAILSQEEFLFISPIG